MIALLSTAAGAGLGYGWYRLVGCANGTCLITARWWTSTAYGAFMGWVMAGGLGHPPG